MNKTDEQAVQTLREDLQKVIDKLGGIMKTIPIVTSEDVLCYGNVKADHIHRPYPNDDDTEDHENCFNIYLDYQSAEDGVEVFDREAVKEIVLTYILEHILPLS